MSKTESNKVEQVGQAVRRRRRSCSRSPRGPRISAEALYVRAGILEERPASAVTNAVFADLEITERHKQALLDIYQSFRRENEPADAPDQTDPTDTSTTGDATSPGSVTQPHRTSSPNPER